MAAMPMDPAALERFLRRVLRDEIAERLRPTHARGTPTIQGASRKVEVPLTDSDLTAGGTGKQISVGGEWLTLSGLSHAAATLEVCFGFSPLQSSEQWIPMYPGRSERPPSGQRFDGFRVRRRTSTYSPSATDLAVFVARDVYTPELLHEPPRGPHITDSGAVSQLLRFLTLAGAEVTGRASDEGAAAVAGWSGSAYVRLLASAAGWLSSRIISGQDGIAAGAGVVTAGTPRVTLADDDLAVSRLVAWNESDRLKANIIAGETSGVAGGIGEPDTDTLRVIPARVALAAQPSSAQTATGTSATAIAANGERHRAVLQNTSPTESLHFALGQAAQTYHPKLGPGDSVDIFYIGAINVIRAGSSDCAYSYFEEYHPD